MIFCKSKCFLQETEETLASHVAYINFVFGVELKRVNNVLDMEWFVAKDNADILYMSGHTNDAVSVLSFLHKLCTYGVGTQIKAIYLNTCSSKPDNEVSNVKATNAFGIVFISEASEEEKKKLGIAETRFVTLDNVLEEIKDDGFKINLCRQDTVLDVNVKMARFLPMDECGLGFSPTESELLMFNHRGSLSEKLSSSFENIQ